MDRHKKIGISLIIIGIVFPLLLLILTSNYDPKTGWFSNLMQLEIVLGTIRKSDGTGSADKGIIRKLTEKKIAVPYRFPLAFGIFLIFAGLRQFDLARRPAQKEPQ